MPRAWLLFEHQVGLELLADRRRLRGTIDPADAARFGLRPGQVGGAHALEERAVLALEAIERFARARQPLARDLVAAVEKQGAVRAQAGMHRRAEALDEIHRHALPRPLISGGRVGEAVADDPASRSERRADDALDVIGARREEEQGLG